MPDHHGTHDGDTGNGGHAEVTDTNRFDRAEIADDEEAAATTSAAMAAPVMSPQPVKTESSPIMDVMASRSARPPREVESSDRPDESRTRTPKERSDDDQQRPRREVARRAHDRHHPDEPEGDNP